MLRYILRRTGFFVVGLFATSVLIFLLIRLVGGDVAVVILGKDATPEAIANLQARYGLDRPLIIQYTDWAVGLLQGNMGSTFRTGEAVGPQVVEKLSVSLPLAAGGILIMILIALPLGAYAAQFAGTRVGSFLAFISQVGIAVPVFWAGVLLALLFGVQLGWLPTGGWVSWQESPLGAIRSLVLPCMALGITEAAVLSRYVRSSVMDVLGEDYVRTARATGLSRGKALFQVALPNAALPLITVLGVETASVIGGAVIVEKVFSMPGLSSMIVAAVAAREVIVVQSIVMVLVALVMAINLAADILIGVLNPKVRLIR